MDKKHPKNQSDIDSLLAGIMKDGHLLSNGGMIYQTLRYTLINQVMLAGILREVVALQIQVKGGDADAETVDRRLFDIREKMIDEVETKISAVIADIAAETKDHFPYNSPPIKKP